MTITAKILKAAQDIAIDGHTTIQLTDEEYLAALEIAQRFYCPGCG